MSAYDDRLKDYVDVKTRVAEFYAKHPDGRLVTTDVRVSREPDDVPRVWVEAAAYRTPDDPLPGRGWDWMTLPGTTPYTRGSELANTETSAWGRAIGSLGIGIAKSIASADEVRAKSGADVTRADDGALIGTLEVGDRKSSDFELRQTPDGEVIGFRLRGQKGGILVRAHGPLAAQLAAFREAAVGATVTCWGEVSDETFTPRGGKAPVTYQVLAAERVSIPGVGVLPTDTTPEENEAPGAATGLTEADSEALWASIDEQGGV